MNSPSLHDTSNYLYKTTDFFYGIAVFDKTGQVSGKVNSAFGHVQKIRIRIAGESENWIILHEIALFDKIF